MRGITINALVDIGCLITFIPSLISGLVSCISFSRKAEGGAAAGLPT